MHILGQNIGWYSPEMEAINWWLHCRTIQAVIKVKSWAKSVEYWVLSTECWALSAKCWVLSVEYWVLSTECWVMSAECWLQQFTAVRGFLLQVVCPERKPQNDSWFLSVVHILCQKLHWYSPKMEAINWRLHCMTILAVIKGKSWAQSVEC